VANESPQNLRVSLASDKSSASLTIPGKPDPKVLPEEAGEAALREAGVEINPRVRQAVAELFEKARNSEKPVTGEVAFATPPANGTDGYVEWTVDDAKEDARPPDAAPSDGTIDYRNVSAFVMVQPSQVLGNLHQHTEGEDGRDVTGKTLPAKAGKPAKLETDESIFVDAAGTVIAQQDGVLRRDGSKASIRKLLEIPGHVDYSTGNVDFNGDVEVNQGVRDRFVVKAGGDVQVRGLIEAAMIETGQDLRASGGFAGRERGNARVGRDLIAKYLDNVQGQVFGDLKVDREIINCELTIHGAIDSPNGSIIGGRVRVAGAVSVACIGSGGGVPTELLIGSIPRLEQPLHRLVAMSHELAGSEEKYEEEQRLLAMSRRPSATEKERQCELMFEIAETQTALHKARAASDALAQHISAKRVVDVRVTRKLFHGVRFRMGDVVYRITDEIKGPLRIELSGRNELRYRVGDGNPKPLNEIADIQTTAQAA
jgi:uncharacterized protein